jgi:hypothetical protein
MCYLLLQGDGEGQSTKDKLSFQTLAVKHAKHPKVFVFQRK